MKLVAKLTSPLCVVLPRVRVKDLRFHLNLNVYRNQYYITLNQVKTLYKELMRDQIDPLPVMSRVSVRYTLFPGTKRKIDTHNVCIIHEKFFMDALVELGKIPDDNYLYYLETGYKFGKIDRSNPRVEIEIYEHIGSNDP